MSELDLPRDWKDDEKQAVCKCHECHALFIGRPDRVVCKECHDMVP